MKCPKCKKPLKENTEGNKRYCQGHSILEVDFLYCPDCGQDTAHSPNCAVCGSKK